jgi:hypothetical protein
VGIEVQFHEEDWARVQGAWDAWWAGELERPLLMIEDVEPSAEIDILNLGPPASSFPLDMPVDELLDYYQVRLEAKCFYGDAWPRWWPNFGPGIVAGFLGARTIVRELGGRGFAFYILQPMPRAEAESFLRVILDEE